MVAMSEECILEFVTSGIYVHPQRKWKMGISQDDHKWLTETLGCRAKNEEKWNRGLGAWRYLGSVPIPALTRNGHRAYLYKVRMLFRSKSHAALFKLARVGDI